MVGWDDKALHDTDFSPGNVNWDYQSELLTLIHLADHFDLCGYAHTVSTTDWVKSLVAIVSKYGFVISEWALFY